MQSSFLRQRRIGLVLVGGGAKGAYQIGCCEAFRKAGITRFDALAGTSVGAMNAVLIASGNLAKARTLWEETRVRDVMSLNAGGILRLPLWGLAAFGSEFSPFKVWRFSDTTTHPSRLRRYLYPLACLLAAVLLFWLAPAQLPDIVGPAAFALAAAVLLCAILGLLHGFARPVMLKSTPFTNSPLGRRLYDAIDDGELEAVRKAGIPIFATLSRFSPYTLQGRRWAGWVPEYVRLDQMSRDEANQTLLDGSALPGIMPAGGAHGNWCLDGSWTDNIPAAPLLFHPGLDLDVIFVMYLRRSPRHTRRANSLLGLVTALNGIVLPRASDPDEEIWNWARARWTAADGATEAQAKRPRIVRIMPSKRMGNFFTATCWFSPTFAKKLIRLGEEDVTTLLERLDAETDVLRQAPHALNLSKGTQGREPAVAVSTASVALEASI
jgi:predicted acylesterase/phospholipase RssA